MVCVAFKVVDHLHKHQCAPHTQGHHEDRPLLYGPHISSMMPLSVTVLASCIS